MKFPHIPSARVKFILTIPLAFFMFSQFHLTAIRNHVSFRILQFLKLMTPMQGPQPLAVTDESSLTHEMDLLDEIGKGLLNAR